MRLKTLSTIGTALFIISLPYSCLLILFLYEGPVPFIKTTTTSSSSCQYSLSDVQLDRKVISSNESVSLKVILNSESRCTTKVTISTPTFETSPSKKTQEIDFPVGTNVTSLVWILTPKKEGLHVIGIRAGHTSTAIRISVTNILGLTPKQAQIFSYIGTFFGGPFTFVGLYNLWMKYQNARRKTKEEELKAQESLKKSNSIFSLINRFRRRN